MCQGIVEFVSPRHVRCWLEEASLKPHQSRDWLSPPEDPEVEDRVTEINTLYLTAQERASQGERTVSIDEKSGIQALERAEVTLPMRAGHVERLEFE